jgi:hypothetical protein
MNWLCQIKTNQSEDMIAQNIILLRIFSIGLSYCQINGDHVELTLGVGPLSGSFGLSVWRHLLP